MNRFRALIVLCFCLWAVAAVAASVSTPNLPTIGPVSTGDLLVGTRNGITYNLSWPPNGGISVNSFLGSVTTANPSINGDLTSGFYSSGAARVDVNISGKNVTEWSPSGLGFTTTSAPGSTFTGVHMNPSNALTFSTSGVDRFDITSAGLIQGTVNATALPATQTGTILQLGNADATDTRIAIDAFGAVARVTGARYDGTNASPTALQSGDEISSFNSYGYNGTNIAGPAASVRQYAAANWTTTSNPTYVDIAATPSGSTTEAEIARFNADGGVTLPSTVTGGDQGAGTLNAAGLYVNGVAVSTGSSAVNLGSLTTANPKISGDVTSGFYTAGAAEIDVGISGSNVAKWTSGGTNLAGTTTVVNLKVTGTCTGCGASAAFSSFTPASGSNTIDNGSNAQEWDWNALTTGTALKISSTGITSGKILDIEANNGGNSTGYAGYFQNTTTGTGYGIAGVTTGASNTGYGVYGLNNSASGYGVYGSSSSGVAVYSNGPETITSTSANSLAVGPAGTTTPVFSVDSSTASQNTGLNVKGAAASGVTTVQATGTNAGLTLTSTGIGNVILQAASANQTVRLEAGSNVYLAINSTGGGLAISPAGNAGATNIPFTFTPPATTGITASTNSIVGVWNTATRQHSTGALTLQEDYVINGITDGFVGSSTLTDGATLTLVPKSCGTNGTCTRESALYIPSAAVTGTVGTAYAINVAAPTGATTNRGAQILGGAITDGIISGGTKFTTSGCSVSSTTGGAAAGQFTVGANTCSVVITINGATGLTAPNGWSCHASDQTAPLILISETSSNATTATLNIPATAGTTDTINFGCQGY